MARWTGGVSDSDSGCRRTDWLSIADRAQKTGDLEHPGQPAGM
jgi:hypothetical protein